MVSNDVFEVVQQFVNYDDLYDLGSEEFDPLSILLKDEEEDELTIPSVRKSTLQFGEIK